MTMLVPATQLGGHVDVTGLEPIVSARVTMQVEVLKVFTDGLLLTLFAVLAEDPVWQMGAAIGRRWWKEQGPWLGVQFADGSTATFAAGQAQPGGVSDLTAVRALCPYPSRGNRLMWLPFFVTPLPPPGPVDLVVKWPALDLAERHTRIDGQILEDARQRVTSLAAPPG